MTASVSALPGLDVERSGVIGGRQLTCVQTFFVSRLTSHPVQLVPGTFIAVTGRGPRGDSNGSGKTSFLGAVSLLLGDREWHLAGPRAPVSLLFDARAAGGTGSGEYESAGHGYVVGLFTDPQQPAATARTVWMRIDTSPPYVTVRWCEGPVLVETGSDREAHEAADAVWASLPRNEHGFNSYARVLFGDAPRCLAYVQQRGDAPNEPSLLQMNAGSFPPDGIGDSLIRLTGQRHLLDTEREQRTVHAEHVERVETHASRHETTFAGEELHLHDVARRDNARELLERADEQWSRHFAAGLIENLERKADLDADLDRARGELDDESRVLDEQTRALTELERRTDLGDQLERVEAEAHRAEARLNDARLGLQRVSDERTRTSDALAAQRQAARGWQGGTVADAEAGVQRAASERDDSMQRLGAARQAEQEAVEELAAVEQGGSGLGGRARRALRAAGVAATVLIDGTVVTADGRERWEPLLAPWADAVVLEQAIDLEIALAALADEPGAILIGAPSPEPPRALPTGVAEAPVGSVQFLEDLARDHELEHDPSRVHDRTRGVHVIGGFADPIAGRDARRARAAAALASARGAVAVAQRVADGAGAALLEGERELARSRAAAAVVPLESRIAELDASTTDLRAGLTRLAELHETARAQWVASESEVRHHESRLDALRTTVEAARVGVARAREEVGAVETQIQRLDLAYWHTHWAGDAHDARELLADDERLPVTFRREATDLLNKAMWSIGVGDDPDAAPTPALAGALRSRTARRAEETEPAQAATFDELHAALRDYLDGWSDPDRLMAATIADDRRGREEEIATLRHAEEEVRHNLERVQDATATLIEGSLIQISGELDRIRRAAGHYGAELHVETARPERPTDRWKWNVVPRWRRVHGGPMTRYDTRANTAQEKLFTVHLVLAALLAAPDPAGRVLVLDELGDSLGDEHRRQVLDAITTTAQRTGITVLGTCQDSVLADAAAHCGEILYFEHVADSEVLNRPTRMFGYDDDHARVELTRDVIVSGRPPV